MNGYFKRNTMAWLYTTIDTVKVLFQQRQTEQTNLIRVATSTHQDRSCIYTKACTHTRKSLQNLRAPRNAWGSGTACAHTGVSRDRC